MKVSTIEIQFPLPVEVSNEHRREIDAVLRKICAAYMASAPGRVMWPFGQGFKMLVNPLKLSDDEPIPFDENTYHIEIAEREA